MFKAFGHVIKSGASSNWLLRRPLSQQATNQFVQLEQNEKTGIAVLSLNRPPVNSLNLELLKQMRAAIEEVESNSARGLILTSTSNKVFCAGLDLNEMLSQNLDRMREFWSTMQDVSLGLFGSNVPTAALINGHSPAGGCVFSTCCEYRVMLPNFRIGLNETLLGMVPNDWIMAMFTNVLPIRIAEMALTQGKLFTTDEALAAGLVDQVAANKEEGLLKCLEFFNRFKGINSFARAMTKIKCRQHILQDFENNREKDLDFFMEFYTHADRQKTIGEYLKGLSKK